MIGGVLETEGAQKGVSLERKKRINKNKKREGEEKRKEGKEREIL